MALKFRIICDGFEFLRARIFLVSFLFPRDYYLLASIKEHDVGKYIYVS